MQHKLDRGENHSAATVWDDAESKGFQTCLKVVEGDLKVGGDPVQVDVNVWDVVEASDQVRRLETAGQRAVLHDY